MWKGVQFTLKLSFQYFQSCCCSASWFLIKVLAWIHCDACGASQASSWTEYACGMCKGLWPLLITLWMCDTQKFVNSTTDQLYITLALAVILLMSMSELVLCIWMEWFCFYLLICWVFLSWNTGFVEFSSTLSAFWTPLPPPPPVLWRVL